MKSLKFIAAVALTAITFVSTSCEPQDTVGKVRYSIGAASMHISTAADIATWGILEAAYAAECNSISGVTYVSATEFEMEGNYKVCDEKVKTACLAVENKLGSDITMDGNVTIEVTATYYVGGGTSTVYSKTWGNK